MNTEKYYLGLDDISTLLKDLFDNVGKDTYINEIIVIFLNAKVGSGKTTLVRYMASYLGVVADVSSPTFSIMNNYEDKIFHYDLYNTKIEKFISLGMLEYFAYKGIHIVEWGDDVLKEIIKADLNVVSINIEFSEDDENKRFYEVIYG